MKSLWLNENFPIEKTGVEFMIKIIEMDQWSSTGNVQKFSFSQWENGEAFNKLRGGDSEVIKAIGIARAIVKEVDENDRPNIGCVWFRCGENGFPELWKSNYDSSG